MTERQLALRGAIMESFAARGRPPEIAERTTLHELAARHVVVLDAEERIVMAHPFAAHRDGARVDAGERTWWGDCAWDGFGIVAALGLRDAVVTDASGRSIGFRDGRPVDAALFHVAVPARRWWADIGAT